MKEKVIDYTKRIHTNVQVPIWDYIAEDELFDKQRKPKIENLKQHLIKEGRVHPDHIIEIVQQAKAILKNEPNLLKLQDPITGIIYQLI